MNNITYDSTSFIINSRKVFLFMKDFLRFLLTFHRKTRFH